METMEKRVNFESKLEKCHLRGLSVCKPFVFAGMGSSLHIIKTNENGLNESVLSQRIFKSFIISQIQTFNNFENDSNIEIIIAINGNRFLSVYRFSYNFIDNGFEFNHCLENHNFYDWILTVKVISELIFVVKAHNEVVIFNWKSGLIKDIISGSDKCILYSAELLSVTESPTGFVLSSGTVFKEIIVWMSYQKQNNSSFISKNLQRLKGHDGVIFAIKYNKELNLLVSASDDRSVRIWSSNSSQFSDSIDFWSQNKFTLYHVFYGHLSRIWSVVAISDPFPIVITVGEDSYIYFWDINEKKLIQRVDGHRNASLWTIASDTQSITYFGGSDSCLNSYDINHSITPFKSVIGHDLNPKQIKFIANKTFDIFCSTISGDMVFMSSDKCDINYKTNSDYKRVFATYSTIDVNEKRNKIVLGSKSGEIAFIEINTENDIPFKISIERIQNSKVFSVCFVNSSHFMCSDIEGKIKVMSIKDMNPIAEYALPTSRHRWPTAGLLLKDLLIVGDRCGSVFVYLGQKENPFKEFRHLHGSNGVTAIRPKPNSPFIYSSGRNGKIYEYLVEEKNCSLLRIFRIFSEMDWIGDFQFDTDSSQMSYVYGFQSRNFVVWDEREQTFIEGIECGGGHRSWDFAIHSNHYYFCYTKNEKVFRFKKKISKIKTESKHWISKPSHTKKINCCSILFRTTTSLEFATAGEDNVIHLNRLNIETNDWAIDSYLFGHISNISAITSANHSPDICYLISVGGRSQLMVWQITRDSRQLIVRQLFNKFLWTSDNLQNRVYKTNNFISSADPQIRYLDVNMSEYSKGKYLVSTACSDSAVRVFELDINLNTFDLVFVKSFNSNCILRVLNDSTNALITASNDGSVKLWSFQRTSDTTSGDCESTNMSLLLDIECHECGVNGIDLFHLNDDLWLIASGGDDNSLVLSLVKNQSNNLSLVCILKEKYIHSSQITGIKILSKSYIVSAAIDQRIIVWKYSFDEKNSRLDANPIGSYVSCIADISSIISSFVPNRKNNYKTIVCGEGFEVIEIDLFDTEEDV